jgi:hypothetical protein
MRPRKLLRLLLLHLPWSSLSHSLWVTWLWPTWSSQFSSNHRLLRMFFLNQVVFAETWFSTSQLFSVSALTGRHFHRAWVSSLGGALLMLQKALWLLGFKANAFSEIALKSPDHCSNCYSTVVVTILKLRPSVLQNSIWSPWHAVDIHRLHMYAYIQLTFQ